MKAPIFILLTMKIVLIVSCNDGITINESLRSQEKESMYDSLTIAVIPFDQSTSFAFEHGTSTSLNKMDHQKIEKILEQCMQEYNSKNKGRNHQTITRKTNEFPNPGIQLMHLNAYKRQYIAILNSEGEKLVWVNCFCRSYDDQWKQAPVLVKDGGGCYFNLKVNLTKGTYFDFSVNGEG